jgi:hypothetical protein
MKLSIDRINEVIKAGEKLEDSKLKFTFDKFLKRVTEANKIATDKFNEQAEDLRVDFCSVDEKGNIIRDEKGGYLFTKENQKACMKALKAIQVTELEFEFNPMLSTPEGLTEDQLAVFDGILIPILETTAE